MQSPVLAAMGTILLVLAMALLALGCGSSAKQRQAMMRASEARAEATHAQKAGTPGAPVAPGTVGQRSPDSGPTTFVKIDEATYRVAPGDLLDVKFPFHPEENQRAPVRPDGRINLPITGDVNAGGLTVLELQTLITEKASVRLRGPVVTIGIMQLAEHRVFVTGQVAKPGYVVFKPGITTIEAITERGGFVDDAKLNEVIHLHRQGDQMVTRKVDLAVVVEGHANDENTLSPNDIVIVPRTWIGDADVFVDQWIRGLLPTIPRPGFDLPLLFF